MERVQSKHGGNKGALPASFCHPLKNKKEQQCVCNVKEKIREVVPSRLQSEELNIQHMGNPCHRMPVRDITGRECPSNPFHRNTVLNMNVFCYVFRIVEIDEIEIFDLPEYHQGGNCQEKVNKKDMLIFCHNIYHGRTGNYLNPFPPFREYSRSCTAPLNFVFA